MAGHLDGKHAVVTGASRGIGAAIAAGLAKAGAKVTLLGRDLEALKGRERALAGVTEVTAIAADVTSEDEVRGAFAEARTAFGPVDILVNNAGISGSAPLAKIDLAGWNAMFAVNVTATLLCCREAVPGMARNGFGRVVNIASGAGLQGYGFIAAYCASKHAVIGLTRSLAQEFARKGVTVNALCPSYTNTDMTRRAISSVMAQSKKSEEEALAMLLKHNPQNRLVQPDEVAEAVAWLCSPGAVSINGQAISMTGGEVMR